MRLGLTGSEGLIGTALRAAAARAGMEVDGLDLRAPDPMDIRDAGAVRGLAERCDAIVHLAAISRVVWGQRDPELCRATNVGGTALVLEAAAGAPHRPFVVVASSREVYGEPMSLPVREDAPLRPINVYGETKAEGERLALAARDRGLRTAVVRFSNVYGSVRDHADRVLPAFARAAAHGGEIRVDGADHTFDFTHLDDVTRALLLLLRHMANVKDASSSPAPLHLASGTGTTLAALAALALEASGGRARVRHAGSRNYDVARFVGDPARAERVLGWRAETRLEDGFRDLVRRMAAG